MSSDPKRCKVANDILAKLKPTIQKVATAKNQEAANDSLTTEYLKCLGYDQRRLDSASDSQMVAYLQSALAECVLQLNALSQKGGNSAPKHVSSDLFNTMIHVEKMVIRIQAKFRQQLALKRLEKMNQRDRELLERKNSRKGMSGEEEALKTLKTRLEKKGLTPESFFRVCDPEYLRVIPAEEFKRQITKQNIGLTRGQVSRLVLILDENMEGNISLDEYYSALEAYGQSVEQHFSFDGSGPYIGFQQRAIFKLLEILDEKGISYQELFNMCDSSRDGLISVSELQQVLLGLSAEFYQKEIQAIHNFFDIDSNDTCSYNEFMQQFIKAEQMYARNKQRAPKPQFSEYGQSRFGMQQHPMTRSTMGSQFQQSFPQSLNQRQTAMQTMQHQHIQNDFNSYETVDDYIAGFSMAQKGRQEDLMRQYLIGVIEQGDKTIPKRVFQMASGNRQGSVQFGQILNCLKRVMTQIPSVVADNIGLSFGLGQQTVVSLEQFEGFFQPQQKGKSQTLNVETQKKSVDKKESKKEKSPVRFKKDDFSPNLLDEDQISQSFDQDQENPDAILKYFCQCLERDHISPVQFFKQADHKKNKQISMEEFGRHVIHLFPREFKPINYQMMFYALDMDKNAILTESEFLEKIENAQRSNVDTSLYMKRFENLKILSQGTVRKYIRTNQSPTKLEHSPTLAKKRQTTSIGNDVSFSKNINEMVLPEYQLSVENVLKYINDILDADNAIKEPFELIKSIFTKITKWKTTLPNGQPRDYNESEELVSESLKAKNGKKIVVHNVKSAFEIVNGLMKEIKLDDKESKVLVYSSILIPNLNTMIISQGDLVKWFTEFYIPENIHLGKDPDYLREKIEDWTVTVFRAKQLKQGAQMLEMSKKSNILEDKWWEYVCYEYIGRQITDKFNREPDQARRLRQMFKECQDKLSYYNFFSFLSKNLEMDLDEWELDSLEFRLDKLGTAYIEFNEFNEFSVQYGYNWKEKIIENDIEWQLEEKLNLSYKDYVLQPSDFFGCHTILTNERAALAKVSQINRELRTNGEKLWVDPDFGPQPDDEKDEDYCVYKHGKPELKGYPKPEEIKWVFASELSDDGNCDFLSGGASQQDCVQGNLGDCWLISALSVIASDDELLIGGLKGYKLDKEMVVDKQIADAMSKGIFPPIFHRFVSRGIFVLRIFKQLTWVYVIIDTRLPVNIKNNRLLFASSTKEIKPKEFWVSLIEKAQAKLHGCYENLISGYIDEGVQELTGFQPEKIILKNERTGIFPHKMIQQHFGGADGFWQFLMARNTENSLMGCNIKGEGKSGQLIIDGKPTGLLMNHAYGLMDVFELDGEVDCDGNPIRLLRLRNPWGMLEWTGPWGMDSQELVSYRKALEKYVEGLPKEEEFNLDNKDDGIFFMAYDDWKDIFTGLFINNDFPEDWTGVRFIGNWNKSNSYGIPRSPADFTDYALNPQFLVRPKYNCEMVMSLSQTGGRLPEGEVVNGRVVKKYFKYPFEESLHYNNVAIFELKENEKSLSGFDKTKLVYLSPVKREVENSGRVTLQGGVSYVIVPTTEDRGIEEVFFLSLYLDLPLRHIDIRRVFSDKNQEASNKDSLLPEFIPEESEKIALITPTWKLQLAKESLPYLIQDNDEELSD